MLRTEEWCSIHCIKCVRHTSGRLRAGALPSDACNPAAFDVLKTPATAATAWTQSGLAMRWRGALTRGHRGLTRGSISKVGRLGTPPSVAAFNFIQLPMAAWTRSVSFAEALEHCGFPITSGPGGCMVKSRSLAARADRALTTPSSGPKHQHRRQWRAATSAPTNATLSSLCSAVNKRPKTAGSAHFRAPYLDTKEAERRQQRASRFGNVPSSHRSVRPTTYRPSPDPNPDSSPSPHPSRLP